MSNKLAIIGASGHGKVVADIAILNGYSDIFFLDDDEYLKECAGFPVVDKIGNAKNYEDCDFIIAIGNGKIRQQIFEELQGLSFVTLIHPSAVISQRVDIGMGTVIMAGTVINTDVLIGKFCIINTCASIDHDCVVGDYVHISVGAHLAGNVKVGAGSWLGIGSTVSNNISICETVLIGAGAVVVKNIEHSGKYVGVPAQSLSN